MATWRERVFQSDVVFVERTGVLEFVEDWTSVSTFDGERNLYLWCTGARVEPSASAECWSVAFRYK